MTLTHPAARRASIFLTILAAAVATVIPVAFAQDEDNAEPILRGLEEKDRFRVPDGFVVEEVASDTLTSSAIALTFDHKGRPVIGVEGRGVTTLLDTDDDGVYDERVVLHSDLESAQGLFVVEPGVYLVHCNGPDGTGLYRATDTDADLRADELDYLVKSDRGIQEHGPHAIRRGPDGSMYVMYGNHAHAVVDFDPHSPSRNLRTDHALPRYLDPRGHANDILVPGGTVIRFSPDFTEAEQFTAGFRNSYDFDINTDGDLFTFESDMEWDIGLPWFRPVRVVHIIAGGDYGWRTGSSKKPFYYPDTLPSVDNIGRGSPVGVAFYHHRVYPAQYHGALFMGDWSRGRIRVITPNRDGATYTGTTEDFLVGEPLNVTDVDVGPDGSLYFTAGGRHTYGGLYRIRYTGPPMAETREYDPIFKQPMPRSAWGQAALAKVREEMGDGWDAQLIERATNANRNTEQRLRALELLQLTSSDFDADDLSAMLDDPDPRVRAFAVYLLGTYDAAAVADAVETALADADPLVQRRAIESLVRVGLDRSPETARYVGRLIELLGSEDRWVRYIARETLARIDDGLWADTVLATDPAQQPIAFTEGTLAVAQSPEALAAHQSELLAVLESAAKTLAETDAFTNYLRVVQMTQMRLADTMALPQSLRNELTDAALGVFPTGDQATDREIQITLAALDSAEAIEPLLVHLESTDDPAEQLHSAYALRAISDGWNANTRGRLVYWFNNAWEFRGGASMEGYVARLWDDTLAKLDEEGAKYAEETKKAADERRRIRAEQLMASLQEEAGSPAELKELANRSFEELADYLEYDPMAYRGEDPERGYRVYLRARCAECHTYGRIGQGGGPDLSTVSARFRRRDTLEAIMFPSRVVSDQYQAEDIELENGYFYTGMPVTENRRELSLLTARGERVDLDKRDIKFREPSPLSIMPEGLLDTMTMGDIVNLMHFLEAGRDDYTLESD